ncbi:MAG: DUF2157 domain-containing protein, partial [Roseibium sp.]|uniref:DUF2157 domain-containing protein n=1 Tax=Roseibium sp. TaxID=1936156 RepID=UPI002636A77B
CLGALAAAWLTGSKTSLVVAAAAAITWQITRSELGAGGLLEGVIGLALLAAVFTHSLVYPARLSRWVAICLLWVTYGRWFGETAELLTAGDDVIMAMVLAGAGGLAAVMILIDPVADLFVKWSSDLPARSHGRWLMTRSMQDAGMLIVCVLVVLGLVLLPEISDNPSASGLLQYPALVPLGSAILLLIAGLLLSFKTAKSQALFAAIGLVLLAILSPIVTVSVLVVAALSLAALISLCVLGTWFNNRFWMLCAYLGLTAVALWLLEETIGSLLGQSLFFLVAGVLLLAMALWLARLFSSGRRSPDTSTLAKEGQG